MKQRLCCQSAATVSCPNRWDLWQQCGWNLHSKAAMRRCQPDMVSYHKRTMQASIQDFSEKLVLRMLLLLLSHFSRVWLCATPWAAAHQAPPSLGFSWQEHWKGLPFPFPMHESEKWKWSAQSCPTLATPWTAAYQAPPSMGFSRQEYWSGVPLPSHVTNAQSLCFTVRPHV